MNYVCKYSPIEILAGFDIDAEFLNPTADNFEAADQLIHSNVCSFSRALIESQLKKDRNPIILTTCCDSMERVCDVLKSQEYKVFMLNLPHNNECCSKLLYKGELIKFIESLSLSLEQQFDAKKFRNAFNYEKVEVKGPYLAVMGARLSTGLLEFIKRESPLPIQNNTCTSMRCLENPPKSDSVEDLMEWYAGELLSQSPCIRMSDISQRRELIVDPNLKGIIYNTVNFCDFYSYEYSKLQDMLKIPMLKIETDYTMQGAGQMKTRLGAFFENTAKEKSVDNIHLIKDSKIYSEISYYAGIDSGSTSTNAVVIDNKKNILSFAVIPTGTNIAISAKRALSEALSKAGLEHEQISNIVTTGYGRTNIKFSNKDVTEITCHAKGAFFLNSNVRTIIDIGGQDNKVIRLDDNGSISDFVMNDKCAAGTGRFIEMMAGSLQLTIEEISIYGMKWKEDIVISSMCSVFAQSEVVSLIAAGKKLEDIVHGINNSVASKAISLGKRGKMEKEFMMTGGVGRNKGVVRAIEEKLGTNIIIPDEPDICGALGAALIAVND